MCVLPSFKVPEVNLFFKKEKKKEVRGDREVMGPPKAQNTTLWMLKLYSAVLKGHNAYSNCAN